ncbi:hypothetical protein OH76DRAFT_823231 [Lentinus brumalis]|uniref:Uncharacterized protein n=1 Tax=Lentinus brumalis TaxID=2498619 RepID=A0A371D278_9APHY|nr:hypothetical protein OH76DRAFT_823231 [Polyporus brumalis]
MHKRQRSLLNAYTDLQASSSHSVVSNNSSLRDPFDSPASALRFASVPPSPTHSTHSSVSTISLLPPAAMPASTVINITAPTGGCGCYECELASRSTSSVTSTSSGSASPQSSPRRSPHRNSAFLLLPSNDPWSYKSAKNRATQRAATRSAQTLPTVDEDSECRRLSRSRRLLVRWRARQAPVRRESWARGSSASLGVHLGHQVVCRTGVRETLRVSRQAPVLVRGRRY